MNEIYMYPSNLKDRAKLWLWDLKDIAVIGISLLISILALTQISFYIPLVITLVYAFLSIRLEEVSVLDFIKQSVRYFITTQQYFEWRAR